MKGQPPPEDPLVERVREARAKRRRADDAQRRAMNERMQRVVDCAPPKATPEEDAQLLQRLEDQAVEAAGRNQKEVRLSLGVPMENNDHIGPDEKTDLGGWWGGVIKWYHDYNALLYNAYAKLDDTKRQIIRAQRNRYALAACDHVLGVWEKAHPRLPARAVRGTFCYHLEICIPVE
jgi:hypothetical protein